MKSEKEKERDDGLFFFFLAAAIEANMQLAEEIANVVTADGNTVYEQESGVGKIFFIFFFSFCFFTFLFFFIYFSYLFFPIFILLKF